MPLVVSKQSQIAPGKPKSACGPDKFQQINDLENGTETLFCSTTSVWMVHAHVCAALINQDVSARGSIPGELVLQHSAPRTEWNLGDLKDSSFLIEHSLTMINADTLIASGCLYYEQKIPVMMCCLIRGD